MRILLACEFYYPSVGGVQEVMRQIGERLAQVGHEVTVATTHLPQRQSRKIRGVAVEEFRISGNLVNGMKGEIDRYRQYILRRNFDVLMIKAAQQWTFDALTSVLDSIKAPKIFIPCGFSGMFDARYKEYFQQMPAWLGKFDRLIFYASDYRDINFARKHGLSNLQILPNGADEREFSVSRDLSFRSRYAIPERAFVVLTVGSVTGAKGHLELARAFEECDFGEAPAVLILVGNTPSAAVLNKGRRWRAGLGHSIGQAKLMYRAGGVVRLTKWVLRPVIERLGLGRLLKPRSSEANVVSQVAEICARINAMKGRRALLVDLPRNDVVQAYLNSNLFVLASKIEYSPLVLFEAAAAGLPSLSVPVGNAAEIAEWTGGGVICDAEVDPAGRTQVNPSNLARQIEALASKPDVLHRLGSSGRRAWEKRFSWNTIFRSYEKIFQECLEKTSA